MKRLFKVFKYWESVFMLFAKHKTLFRFLIVGTINTGVDFLTFTILKKFFAIDLIFCQTVAYSAGILNSFVLNKLWTFESKNSKLGTQIQFIKFVVVNVISLFISVIGLKLLNNYLFINVYISKVLVTGLTQVINYTGYKTWIFKEHEKSRNKILRVSE